MNFKIYKSIREISASDWTYLEDPNFPFLSYSFLLALENSQAVGVESGWVPIYLSLWEDDILQAALCLYKKNNSYGEYIFDWEWARAYESHGFEYYPKLVAAVPFTPATGAKLLLRPDLEDPERIRGLLIREALQQMDSLACSSLHFLFIKQEEIPAFEREKLLIRHSYQFHWENQHYQNFTDFLSTLKRKRRQQISKERRSLQERGLKIHAMRGRQIEPEHMHQMYLFYLNTIQKNWAIPYLNESFFQEIYQRQREDLLLIFAAYQNRWVGGSINFVKGKNLYGRYWGCIEEHAYLHFELCYYQNIEYAIQYGLQHFEAGAQGGHKMLRGLSPALTYSAHYLREAGFHQAIGRFIEEEKKSLRMGMQEALKHDAYK